MNYSFDLGALVILVAIAAGALIAHKLGGGAFWRSVFSDGDQGSSSRVLTVFLNVIAAWCVIHLTLKNGSLPDMTTLGGLSAWANSPYLINRGAGVLTSSSANPMAPTTKPTQ